MYLSGESVILVLIPVSIVWFIPGVFNGDYMVRSIVDYFTGDGVDNSIDFFEGKFMDEAIDLRSLMLDAL